MTNESVFVMRRKATNYTIIPVGWNDIDVTIDLVNQCNPFRFIHHQNFYEYMIIRKKGTPIGYAITSKEDLCGIPLMYEFNLLPDYKDEEQAVMDTILTENPKIIRIITDNI